MMKWMIPTGLMPRIVRWKVMAISARFSDEGETPILGVDSESF